MISEEMAKAYADMICAEYPYEIPTMHSEVRQAYLQGAKDADTHTAWRMCCSELPPLEERSERFSQDVIIAVQIGNEYEYGFSSYDYHNEYWVGSMPGTFIPNVVAWLPLPKFTV